MSRTVEVTGPVTGGTRGWAFSLPLADLGAVGYVAEEFFLEGEATAYRIGEGGELDVDGRWDLLPNRTAPFRTRMLVVRPRDPTRANGVVHVNWQNVTAGFEIGSADNEQLFDGFLLLVDFGRGAVPDTSEVDPASAPMGMLPAVPVRIRDDLGVPTLVFNSETESSSLYPVRQPDTDRFRLWEVAGTCHTGGAATQEQMMAPLIERDGIEFALGGTAGAAFVPENPNVLSCAPAHRAAFHHLNEWLAGGPPPPAQDRIGFSASDPPTIARDASGNALGGIRLPDFDVPTGEHTGTGTGDLLASLVGYSRPFTADELGARYPSRDAYLSHWEASLQRAVDAGFVLPGDAPAMRALAEETATAVFLK